MFSTNVAWDPSRYTVVFSFKVKVQIPVLAGKVWRSSLSKEKEKLYQIHGIIS